jgi:hypothetical protein
MAGEASMVGLRRGEMQGQSFGTGDGDGGTYFFESQSSSIEGSLRPLGDVLPILTPVYGITKQPLTKTLLRTSFPFSPLLNIILIVILSIRLLFLLKELKIPDLLNILYYFTNY